ncbi:MAG: GAF domain-containing sensor histidine kinase [Pseudoclavibacter sp.]
MSRKDSGAWGRLDDADLESRRQGQIVAAIARTAANLASRASLESLLAAIAEELQEIDGIAAAQLILVERRTGALRVMGASGFAADPEFLGLLESCHRLGAPLATYAALEAGGQLVYRDRRSAMVADARWRPLHSYVLQVDWSDFVATPFAPQGGDRGVIHCYLSPGFEAGQQLSEFLLSMADQAALAIDYHDLIEGARTRARTLERQRIARDLHDSVIQNVFSIGMHARALESIGGAIGDGGAPVTAISRDLQALAQQVQGDLRGIVRALQPSPAAEHGLASALDLLADAMGRRANIPVSVAFNGAPDPLPAELVDDLYYIASEGMHNAVKHAAPTRISVEVDVRIDAGQVVVRISDDGVGLTMTSVPTGHGLVSMRYRAARWHGTLEVAPGRNRAGTTVTAELSVPIDERPTDGGAT